MKSLALAAAALFGTTAGAYVLPYAGPVHAEVTKPFSLYGEFPVGATSLSLGGAGRDFVVTDIIIGRGAAGDNLIRDCFLTVNGARVLGMPAQFNAVTQFSNDRYVPARELHLTTGLPIPRTSVVGVQVDTYSTPSNLTGIPVTVLGYIH